MNKMKKKYLLLLSSYICFNQTINTMQQANIGARSATEQITNAVSNYFSTQEETIQQNLPSLEIDIKEIINDPDFKQSIADAVQEEIEETRPKSPDYELSSDQESISTEEGIPLLEIIEKISNSKLAEWLRFSKPKESIEDAKIYTKQEIEQLRIALNGRFSQNDLPELNNQAWQEIITDSVLLQNLLDGFYGKKDLKDFEENIEIVKEKLISILPQTSKNRFERYHTDAQKNQEQTNFKKPSLQIQNELPKSAPIKQEPSFKQRIISRAPQMPKRNPMKDIYRAKNYQLQKPIKTQDLVNQDVRKLLEDQAALSALIKQAAANIESTKELVKLKDRYEKDTAKDLEAFQSEPIKKGDAFEKNDSKRKSLIKQHHEDLLVKKEQEQREQEIFNKKINEQHKKQKRFIKKREQEEKQKLKKEQAKLQEREKNIKQSKQKQQEDERKAIEKALSYKKNQQLNSLEKKQKKLDKDKIREEKHTTQEEQDARTKVMLKEDEAFHKQITQELQRAINNTNLKKEREELEENEHNLRESTYSDLKKSLEKIVKETAELKQDAIAKQSLREQQQLDKDAVADKLLLESEYQKVLQNIQQFMNINEQHINQQKKQQEATEQNELAKRASIKSDFDESLGKLIHDLENLKEEAANKDLLAQKKQTEEFIKQQRVIKDEALNEKNKLNDELENTYNQLRNIEQQNRANLFAKEQENLTANLFDQLPEQGYLPSAKEQQQYDAAIAKKIGQKRNEIEIQKTFNTESLTRKNLEHELEKELLDLKEKINALEKNALKKEQLQKEQGIAKAFSELPESDIITSAKSSQPFEPATPKLTRETTPKTTTPTSFSQGKTPTSYAKDPFSDENAEAIKNMFEQNQSTFKRAPKAKPTGFQNNNMPTEKDFENGIPQHQEKNEKTDNDSSDTKTEQEVENEPEQELSQETKNNSSPKIDSLTDGDTIDHSKTDSITFQSVPKSEKSKQTTVTQAQPIATTKATSSTTPNFSTKKQEPFKSSLGAPAQNSQKTKKDPSYQNYDMPYYEPTEELIIDNQLSDYKDPSRLEIKQINSEPEPLSLTYLAPQSLISDRSKQLKPTDTKKQLIKNQKRIEAQEDATIAPEKESVTKQVKTPKVNQKNKQETQSLNNRSIIQKTWDNFLTIINSIILIIKKLFVHL